VQASAPWADVVLLHAEGHELARLLVRRSARVVLLGADHPESIKHAYAGAKLLAQRCGLMTFDLLLAAAAHSPRLRAIEQSLAQCLDNFIGAFLHHTAVVDPAAYPATAGPAPADSALQALLAGQLALDHSLEFGLPPPAPAAPAPQPAHAPRSQTPLFL
jgi:flagellar biosynthesis protein FlhG